MTFWMRQTAWMPGLFRPGDENTRDERRLGLERRDFRTLVRPFDRA
jgi:hypothetical protein